jgi:hypothetical protein
MSSSVSNTTNLQYINQLYNTYSSSYSSNYKTSALSAVTQLNSSSNSYNKASQLSTTDTTLLKNLTNSSVTLYGSASKLANLKNDTKTSNDDVTSMAENFVKNYNSSLETFGENKDRNNTISTIYKSLSGVVTTNKASLEDIGITLGDDGKLSLNKEKLTSSLTSNADKVKSTLSNVGKKAQTTTMNAMTSSTESLLKTSTTTSTSAASEEAYNAALNKLASNKNFMTYYYNATAVSSLFSMLV